MTRWSLWDEDTLFSEIGLNVGRHFTLYDVGAFSVRLWFLDLSKYLWYCYKRSTNTLSWICMYILSASIVATALHVICWMCYNRGRMEPDSWSMLMIYLLRFGHLALLFVMYTSAYVYRETVFTHGKLLRDFGENCIPIGENRIPIGENCITMGENCIPWVKTVSLYINL